MLLPVCHNVTGTFSEVKKYYADSVIFQLTCAIFRVYVVNFGSITHNGAGSNVGPILCVYSWPKRDHSSNLHAHRSTSIRHQPQSELDLCKYIVVEGSLMQLPA
jgi:hypothetical protein